MTQKAATMAMNMRVVWTMGSGIPIGATAACLLCGHRGGRLLKRGDAAAGVGRAQRAAAMLGDVVAAVTARGRPLTAGKKVAKPGVNAG